MFALQWLMLMLAVSLLMFVLFEFSPLDPVQAYIREQRVYYTPEQIAQLTEQFGTQYNWWERYWWWLEGVVTKGLGKSILYKTDVGQLLVERIRMSLPLMFSAWFLSGVFGYLLGVVMGNMATRPLGRVLTRLNYVLMSTPAFWLGLLLVYVFAVELKWLPSALSSPIGVNTSEVDSLIRIKHLILPVLTLTIFSIPPIALYTRQKIQEENAKEYMQFAMLNGVNRFWDKLKLLFPNTILPVLVVQFTSIGELFGGSVLVEQVFSYPGLGKISVEAGIAEDVPLIMGIVLVMSGIIFVGSKLIHWGVRLIDPRLNEKEVPTCKRMLFKVKQFPSA
ncbi:MAG: ABC transporter permease [Aerococcaceae bacterium]|nr:ABC transporter permease [Aerococcaceae bacterium]